MFLAFLHCIWFVSESNSILFHFGQYWSYIPSFWRLPEWSPVQNEVLSYNQFAVSRTLSSLKEMVQSATVILKPLFAITVDTLQCHYADRPMNLQFLWCVNQQERTIFCKKKKNKTNWHLFSFLCLFPVIDNEFCCNLPKKSVDPLRYCLVDLQLLWQCFGEIHDQ